MIIKEKNTTRGVLIIIVFLAFATLSFAVPQQAKAFSLQQILSPVTSVLLVVSEKIQYIFAFTPSSKVKVLENQAQRRLVDAQGQVKGDTDSAQKSIEEYQDIKSKQISLLDKADDNTLKQVQERTVEQQKTLVSIGNSAPTIKNTIKTVNANVVGDIKNIIVLKEGTTAGEAFGQTATITYAPGTGPATVVGSGGSGGAGILVIEGGADNFAPETGGGGQGGQTTSGEETQQTAPVTSETNTGATNVIDNNTGSAPGTSDGGESGNTDVAPGTSSGGMGIESVVGQ